MRDHERSEVSHSDEDLVERGRGGDDSALNALVDRHHAAAYRVAVAVVRSEDAAQDVVQDAFLKAFRALSRFRGDASFRTWLLTIVTNEARGALRRSGRRRETGIDDVGPVQSGEPSPEDSAVNAAEAGRAMEMLQRLPEKQRMSVSLRVQEGLSFREIAEVIDSTEGAARVNYFHGIRRLRELME